MILCIVEYSYLGEKMWPAHFARLGQAGNKYWCSKVNAQKEGEWIQVDLGSVRKIDSIGIKVSSIV